MRKISPRNSDRRRITRLLLLVVGVLIIASLLPRLAQFVGGVVMYPIQQLEGWFAQSSMVLPVLWRDKIEMQEEINTLKQTVAELSRDDLSQRRLFQENNRLRSLLSDTAATRTLAAVIAKPSELPYDMLQIDQGSRAGVEVGSPVYIGNDTTIGLVSAVQPRSAFVTLFTTPGFLATIYLSGADVTATLEGLGGGVARVRLPQGIPMRVGDLVYVPSVQPGVYGQIAWVENEPTQPEQFGYITPNIPIASLFQVAVGQPTQVSTDAQQVSGYIEQLKSDALILSDLVLATSTAATTSTSTLEGLSDNAI